MKFKYFFFLPGIILMACLAAQGMEFHVSVSGNNDWNGSAIHPFRTIAEASSAARAGDTVTVHAGTFREWVDPKFGGTSNLNRIVYRAAPGEEVMIKGSEVVKGWEKVKKGVWKVTLDNSFFGDYNPYRDLVTGDWFLDFGRKHHTGEVYLNGKSFYEIDSLVKVINPLPLKGAQDMKGSLNQWYCESDSKSTTIWANFHESDPNRELVEINVRPAVFYPKKTGINYITVSGFRLSQAATPWAAPTAEQLGLIGPNWSRGWIIENNIISDSKCSGITLGTERSTGQNYSSEYKIKNGHTSQLETVFGALKNGWSKENVGSHIIRNNTISNCEKSGICGNLGAIFSQIYNNHVFDIYTKRQWGGFEMAGIKFHAPIDVLIKDNCIHNSFKGIWIDWQAQGIRISGNLLYNNSWMDLHLEVSHGPHIIDNNCFLSSLNLWNISTGSAFVHNLFAGQICKSWENERYTPYHYPHSTKIAGIVTTQGGDDRWLNNIFVKTPAPSYDIFENAKRLKREPGMMGFGLSMFDNYPVSLSGLDYAIGEMSTIKLPVRTENNLYLNGAAPYRNGVNEKVINNSDVDLSIEEKEDGTYLHMKAGYDFAKTESKILSSFSFGEALVPGAVFDIEDGSPILFDKDYFNKSKEQNKNLAGPIANLGSGDNKLKLWPK